MRYPSSTILSSPSKSKALLLIILLAAMLFTIPQGHGQVESATLGFFLETSLSKLQQIITQAQEAGRVVVIEAAVQAQSTITAAKVAYKDSLQTTISELHTEEKKIYQDVTTLLDEIEKGTTEALTKAITGSQTIANSLPFAKKFPQLTSMHDAFALPTQTHYHVTFSGNFPYAFTEQHRPVLRLKGTTFPSHDYKTQEIAFDIPISDIGSTSASKITNSQAMLDIPWDGKAWWELGNEPKICTFECQLAKLPTEAGTLTVTHTTPVSSTEIKPFVSESWIFDSSTNDIEEDRSFNVPEKDQAEGWKIDHDDPSHPISFDMVHEIEGRMDHDWWNKGLQSVNDTTAVWKARTERHHIGHSGKIEWRIRGFLIRTTTKQDRHDETRKLSWNMNQFFDYPSGTWSAKYTRFDGFIGEFQGTNTDSPFFKVKALGDKFQIMTFPQ